MDLVDRHRRAAEIALRAGAEIDAVAPVVRRRIGDHRGGLRPHFRPAGIGIDLVGFDDGDLGQATRGFPALAARGICIATGLIAVLFLSSLVQTSVWPKATDCTNATTCS